MRRVGRARVGARRGLWTDGYGRRRAALAPFSRARTPPPSPPGNHAFIGLGFNTREDAFDLKSCLSEVERAAEAESKGLDRLGLADVPSDLLSGLKAGQSISLKVGGMGGAGGGGGAGAAAGGPLRALAAPGAARLAPPGAAAAAAPPTAAMGGLSLGARAPAPPPPAAEPEGWVTF